jgi:hypothetical protein
MPGEVGLNTGPIAQPASGRSHGRASTLLHGNGIIRCRSCGGLRGSERNDYCHVRVLRMRASPNEEPV